MKSVNSFETKQNDVTSVNWKIRVHYFRCRKLDWKFHAIAITTKVLPVCPKFSKTTSRWRRKTKKNCKFRWYLNKFYSRQFCPLIVGLGRRRFFSRRAVAFVARMIFALWTKHIRLECLCVFQICCIEYIALRIMIHHGEGRRVSKKIKQTSSLRPEHNVIFITMMYLASDSPSRCRCSIKFFVCTLNLVISFYFFVIVLLYWFVICTAGQVFIFSSVEE